MRKMVKGGGVRKLSSHTVPYVERFGGGCLRSRRWDGGDICRIGRGEWRWRRNRKCGLGDQWRG